MKRVSLLVAALILVSVGSAYAGSYSFNFNGIAAGAQSAAIQTYMQTTMTAQGASSSIANGLSLSGAQDSNGYNGDGHVVGTCVGSTCTSKTLANDNDGQPGTDHMIMTMQTGGLDSIKMQFTGLHLYSITFDLEIFPDASCSVGSCTAGMPDFILNTGNGGSVSAVKTWLGAFPTSGSHSPISGSSATETSSQLIVAQYTYTAPVGTTFDTVWFQDWPATIGIDNLTVNTSTQVPEPASIFLMGSGILAVIRRKRAVKK